MAEESVIRSVKNFLAELVKLGIPVQYGVLFGSYAKDDAHRWSDIDLLVVSSKYDETYAGRMSTYFGEQQRARIAASSRCPWV